MEIIKSLYSLFLIVLILSSCAAGRSTRSLPYAALPPPTLAIEDQIKGLKIAVVLFDIKDVKISGGHHEGLMQVRQPWDFGISQEKKDALYEGLPETVRYAIADEFLRQGLNVIVTDGKDMNRLKGLDIIITGGIANIELNTYGHGTLEGFGSAGNYWEAEVILKNVTIYNAKDGSMLWIGDIGKYCKLPDSPAKLDWTIFTGISKSLQASVDMSTVSDLSSPIGAVKKSAERFKGDYFLQRKDVTPPETAARLSAIEIIRKLETLKIDKLP